MTSPSLNFPGIRIHLILIKLINIYNLFYQKQILLSFNGFEGNINNISLVDTKSCCGSGSLGLLFTYKWKLDL